MTSIFLKKELYFWHNALNQQLYNELRCRFYISSEVEMYRLNA